MRKKYILWVTRKDEFGYGSYWYGWSCNLILSYEEAVKKREQIVNKFDDVTIVEF
ncbi:hypothetical protein JUJ52_02785 [Virgibacillus sp. AGTR]|uniref:hypothetical protein n=1 Tax=Virgibacillus sp. AGTR TaxID=2812055 RepID=UPI001D16BE47|nr:hypothetical protein [Virgibacillus sp. AGTR]MCC2248883.1 hypothetical protein [Virgibacillus sp. AGTR]